ncbi:hypothetical protein D3C85_1505940 [compost metagenome]
MNLNVFLPSTITFVRSELKVVSGIVNVFNVPGTVGVEGIFPNIASTVLESSVTTFSFIDTSTLFTGTAGAVTGSW